MEQKLIKAKLFLKKYGIYILLAIAAVFGVVFAFLGSGKDSFWFKIIKSLMSKLNEVQDKLHDIYQNGQKQEDKERHDKEKKDQTINQNAATEQDGNKADLANNANEINAATKDDPEKMGEAFQNAFGIPEGKNQ